MKVATPDERELLANRVESSVAYFWQLAGGHKKPGHKLCRRLVAAEPRLKLADLRPDIWSREPNRRSTDPKS